MRLSSNEKSLLGPSYPVAGLVCLFGFFLHIVLSDPLLNSIGFNYSGDEGRFYEKIHPGTYFIFLSFLILLWSRGNPLHALIKILQEYPVCLLLLLLYVLLFAYMAIRSGPAGLAFIIDTHMTVPICAIVLSYAPLSLCRRAVLFFIAMAVLNGAIGIYETATKTRIFSFDPDWKVLREEHFRASALRGHPLNNAMFTAVALFVGLRVPVARVLKFLLVPLFIAALVAFGSRAAVVFAVVGLMVWGIAEVRRLMVRRQLSMQRLLMLGVGAVLLFAGLLIGVYLLIQSPIGERLAATGYWEKSAESRRLAFQVLDHISGEDMIFGISAEQILSLADRLRMTLPISDIENPWLLMFMHLGLLMFPFWVLTTIVFAFWLMRYKPFALQLAVMAYYLTASTSNSFGRKDSTYLIMVSAVICAAQMLKMPQRVREK